VKRSEREAAERANEILRANASGAEAGGEYGAGRLTKAQRKSQAKHIPFTPGPRTVGQKIKRSLFG
jgi:hypothetical protein